MDDPGFSLYVANPMTTLARRLRLADYFALAFGVMVGTAWLVVMDDILQRGGPLGAILGFTAGAIVLLPIGYVYGNLVRAIPEAAGEAAYVARFFPRGVAFATGWMMVLSYFLTCPFEGLAAGKILGYLFPQLNTLELYRLGGHPTYLPHLLVGIAITVPITWLNCRGVHSSARFAKTATFTFLAMVILFAAAGAKHGTVTNLYPLFSHAPLLSIFLVWQVVPWLLAGFESVGKYAEEASPEFGGRGFLVAIFLTIFAGLSFFWLVISSVAYVAPWQTMKGSQQFSTAIAFERALHAHWIVVLILASALVALLQAFNANMVASSRLLFAMGRSRMIRPALGYVDPVHHTPRTAIVAVGIATLLTMLLGDGGLVPILEVGAVASAVGWMAACASYCRMKPASIGFVAAVFGLLVTSFMILGKVVPVVPGHFTRYEWIALAIWSGVGLLLKTSAGHQPSRLEPAQVSAGTSGSAR